MSVVPCNKTAIAGHAHSPVQKEVNERQPGEKRKTDRAEKNTESKTVTEDWTGRKKKRGVKRERVTVGVFMHLTGVYTPALHMSSILSFKSSLGRQNKTQRQSLTESQTQDQQRTSDSAALHHHLCKYTIIRINFASSELLFESYLIPVCLSGGVETDYALILWQKALIYIQNTSSVFLNIDTFHQL